MDTQGVELTSPELLRLRTNKQDGFNYRYRREQDWRQNYTLYRDRVLTNRLTQRQSVNLPLMKTQIMTLLKDVDDMPVLIFENLDNDKQAELFQNEYWKYTVEQNKLEIKDVVDKKQNFLFGRTFDQMQIIDGMVKISIIDPEDILVPRFFDVTNINSARYLIHTHIFTPLSALEENKDYDKKALAELKLFYATNQGLIKSKTNLMLLELKMQKMADIGVLDAFSPLLGETYVELSMHFIFREEETDEAGKVYKDQFWLYVEADDMQILLKKPLEQVIGITSDHYWQTHLPYNTWADDIDNQDFWTDGKADILRQPNMVLNSWFSQMVENRTLKNFNMNLFDATIEGFNPQTWEAKAWGWYGLPGKPSEVYQPMQIGDLSDSLEEMNFVVGMSEKATGATATDQGAPQESNSITLGEVQLMLAQAKERVKGISKFYTQVWIERGEKFLKLIEAAPEKLDAVRIYKKGRNSNNIYSREIDPSDWMTKLGHRVKVWDQDDKNSQDTQRLQKLNAAVMNMPGNQPLLEIYDRDLLEFCDLKPDDITRVMEFQEQLRQQQMMMQSMALATGQPPQPGQASGQPGQSPQPPMQLPAQAGQPTSNGMGVH